MSEIQINDTEKNETANKAGHFDDVMKNEVSENQANNIQFEYMIKEEPELVKELEISYISRRKKLHLKTTINGKEIATWEYYWGDAGLEAQIDKVAKKLIEFAKKEGLIPVS